LQEGFFLNNSSSPPQVLVVNSNSVVGRRWIDNAIDMGDVLVDGLTIFWLFDLDFFFIFWYLGYLLYMLTASTGN